MTLYLRLPNNAPFPSGRYTRTNPLRREFGLRLLSEPLPEPLRTSLIRAWRRPARYDGKEAIQSAGARASAASENAGTQFPQEPAAEGAHRQRPDAASLSTAHPRILVWLTLPELEVSRRIVEAPPISVSRDTRNRLLISQGHYLYALYAALCTQLGSPEAALDQFLSLLNASA